MKFSGDFAGCVCKSFFFAIYAIGKTAPYAI
jgi:hypothetical protein